MSLVRTSSRLTIVAALVVVAPIVLAGCSSKSDPSSTPAAGSTAPLNSMLPKDLQGAESLTIASNVEYPPFEFYDADNATVLGIDREIANGLEKQLGIKIVFENIAFDAIIPGLASGRYPMAMSGMTDNLTRQKEVDFVDYFNAGAGVLVKEESKDTLKSIEDLCGQAVGIVKGTTEIPQVEAQSAKCTAAGKEAIESIIFPGQNQTILALQNDRVVAVAMDSAAGAYVAKQTTGLYMNKPYESQPFGIVFAKKTDELQKAVQKGLEAMKESGEYMAALEKFGLESGAIDAFAINGGDQE